MYISKVFLGGTCTDSKEQWDWRKELIDKFDQTYVHFFDPFLRPWETDCDWDEERQQEEIEERELCEYTLYVITSDFKGIYSFCEATADSIKKPDGKCIVAFIDYKDYCKTKKHFLKSINAFIKLCKSNGAVICESIDEIADYLNDACMKSLYPLNKFY